MTDDDDQEKAAIDAARERTMELIGSALHMGTPTERRAIDHRVLDELEIYPTEVAGILIRELAAITAVLVRGQAQMRSHAEGRTVEPDEILREVAAVVFTGD